MKSKAISCMLGLIGCVSSLAVAPLHAEQESKVGKAFELLLAARHQPQGGLQVWAGRLKRNLSVSDEEILGVMIAAIRQDKPNALFANDLHLTGDLVTRISGYGMELYPGNPDLEAAIFDASRKAHSVRPEDTFLLNRVASLGSDELVRESRALITDSLRLELFDREVLRREGPLFRQNQFPEGIRFENWVEQRTEMGFRLLAVGLLLLYSIIVMLFVFVTRKKWRRTKAIGAVFIAFGILVAVLWPWLRGIRWNSKIDQQVQLFAVIETQTRSR